MIPRLSPVEYLILSLAVEIGRPCYAVELVEKGTITAPAKAGRKAQSIERLKRGSVYVTLDRMVTKGLLDRARDYVSSPRYSVSPEGEKLLQFAKQFDKSK